MNIEKVTIYTEKFMIIGEVATTRGGYRKRLSDFLNDRDIQFIVVSKTKLSLIDTNREAIETDVVILNKNEIVMIIPEKEIEF